MGVSCGNPLETGNVPSIMMLMPEEVVGYYETYCTRAFGDSMKDLGIMTGDVLIIECVPEYHSHDIVEHRDRYMFFHGFLFYHGNCLSVR